MNKFLVARVSVIATLLGAISPVYSQDNDSQKDNLPPAKGWYATLGGGVVVPTSPSVSFSISEFSNTGSVTQSTAPSLEVGFGYDFGSIRTEFTYGYTPINSSTLSVANSLVSASAPVSSTYNINSFLFGAYYDIPTKSRWTPYIGGAIGPGLVSIPSFNSVIDGDSYVLSPTTSGVFAYQAKAGVTYAASKQFDLFAEAGYLGTSSLTLNILQGPNPGETVSPLTLGPNGGFLAKIGFRYRIGGK